MDLSKDFKEFIELLNVDPVILRDDFSWLD